MLKFSLDSESFDSLSDAEKTFYSKDGESYQLQVEGAADKNKLDEFRDSNIELMKFKDQYKGVDLEKYAALEAKERENRDKELIDKGEIDTLLAEKIKGLQNDYDAKLSGSESKYSELHENHNKLISKYEIEGAAHNAFTAHKISPDAQAAAMAQIKLNYTVENGKVVSNDGNGLEINAFVAGLPEIFKIQSTGGNGNGGKLPINHQASRTAQEKIKSGLSRIYNSK